MRRRRRLQLLPRGRVMKNLYACPHCGTVLNPNVKIILVIHHRGKRGLILLSPQPGNFKYVLDPGVEALLQTGASVKFTCPACSADLTSRANRHFAELNLLVAGQGPRRVEFSRLYGTHATFVVSGDRVKAYGEDVDDYRRVNFFGV
jgi:predicted RNA-binding Zn-ribbon protein involved in translation (DUF1610 family)